MNQEWFEMPEIRRRQFSKSVWIPLRAVNGKRQGKYGYEGYREEFFGAGSIAVPMKYAASVQKLGWSDIGIRHQHAGYVENGAYVPADVYVDYRGDLNGVHLVLDQMSHDDAPPVWHLNQDLVLTLGLKCEGNSWVSPREGYAEAARLLISDNKPILLEIKAEYLKDYLCARDMALYVTSYYNRDLITADVSSITWKDGAANKTEALGRWKGRVMPIHEGGHPFGEKVAVFHVARTDVVETDDVPDISAIPTDENTKGESWTREFEGRKLYRVMGEYWSSELILPGKHSPKVRGDGVSSSVYFVIDADGSKARGKDLIDAGKWLWFKPDVIMALSHRRGGNLSFYTRETGSVSCSHGYGVHFGVNDLGYVNVYAKDIGLLPEWQQQIWVGYNITPEGGVSSELLASQVRAEPADTQAPEAYLGSGLEAINSLSHEKLGIKLFRDHEAVPELLTKAHRFRALDESSLCALAKDLARIIADNLDAEAMQSVVPPPKGTKWGSLKSLENLLASHFDRDFVREMTAPLVGVYELRHADAHLPSSKIDTAFHLIGIDRSRPYVLQGYMMLHQVVISLFGIREALRQWPVE